MKTKQEIKEKLETVLKREKSQASLIENVHWNTQVTLLRWVLDDEKEKTFEQYTDEYIKKETLLFLEHKPKPEKLPMHHRLGLIWHIVKDQEGDLDDFADIIKLINEGLIRLSSVDTRRNMYNILPAEFIDSFKEEKQKS